jgi:hypothetical protein
MTERKKSLPELTAQLQTLTEDDFLNCKSDKKEGWGIYEIDGDFWLGDDKGPAIFKLQCMAQISLVVTAEQTATPITNYDVRWYNCKDPKTAGEIESVMTAEQAFENIERNASDL